MSKEIKVGDWVRISDVSEDVAQQSSTLYRVTEFTRDGQVVAGGLPWKYAVHPDDVKVLPMEEYKVLVENQMPSMESLGAGQELSFVQVAQWVENHGSTKGLQWRDTDGNWRDEGGQCRDDEVITVIYAGVKYRVAPKKNDPDDPTTWEKGVAIFRRDSNRCDWVLDVFESYSLSSTYKHHSERGAYMYAKLATPEQIEAWKLINGDL